VAIEMAADAVEDALLVGSQAIGAHTY